MKILFSDYDGTLYTGEDSVAKNIEAIKTFRAADHKFVIATGRSLESIQRIFAEHPIPYDYLILNNGSLVTDNQNQFILKHTISPPPIDLVEKIITFAKQNAEVDIDFSTTTSSTKLTLPTRI